MLWILAHPDRISLPPTSTSSLILPLLFTLLEVLSTITTSTSFCLFGAWEPFYFLGFGCSHMTSSKVCFPLTKGSSLDSYKGVPPKFSIIGLEASWHLGMAKCALQPTGSFLLHTLTFFPIFIVRCSFLGSGQFAKFTLVNKTIKDQLT